jgi:hypothetical protein
MMTNQPPYPPKISRRLITGLLTVVVFVGLLLLFPPRCMADGDPDPPYEEILVLMNVQGVGGVQIPAAIRNDVAYLSIPDVLDYLKIKNTVSPGMDSISGFFILQQATFLIEPAHNQIIYQGRKFELAPGAIIRTETDLYLRADYFGTVFGLNCKFNFRSLSILLTTSLDLPVIREIRQEEMRNNLSRLQGRGKR